jgi:hypothetical protein
MEGVHYELDTETQFWSELEEILAPVGSSPSNISVETAVRYFISFTAAFRGRPCTVSIDVGQFLRADEDVESCCSRLFRSELFIRNSDAVRSELIALANEVPGTWTLTNEEIREERGIVYYILGSAAGRTDRRPNVKENSEIKMYTCGRRRNVASSKRRFRSSSNILGVAV